ncbi:MAG TPA: hypothetical protein VMX35_10995 [Acidobacteriota bacterium]|nr:hypothetical protein [Acidobacteriota bacterium]
MNLVVIGGGLLLIILAFVLGLALRLTMFNGQEDEADIENVRSLRFETVHTGPGDYGLLRVDVYFSSAEAASGLKKRYRERSIRQFRLAIDQVFRTAGASAFTRSEGVLVPSERTKQRLLSALEAQARDISAESNEMEGRLVVAVTIHNLPD